MGNAKSSFLGIIFGSNKNGDKHFYCLPPLYLNNINVSYQTLMSVLDNTIPCT